MESSGLWKETYLVGTSDWRRACIGTSIMQTSKEMVNYKEAHEKDANPQVKDRLFLLPLIWALTHSPFSRILLSVFLQDQDSALKSSTGSFCLQNDPGFSGGYSVCSAMWHDFCFQTDLLLPQKLSITLNWCIPHSYVLFVFFYPHAFAPCISSAQCSFPLFSLSCSL